MSPHAIAGWAAQWPWLALFLLGAFHGLNPAMGWLFAVSLGLQQKRRAAVLGAVPPILIGHVVSVTIVVVLLQAFRTVSPPAITRIACAAILVGFGALRLWRSRHPRWVGMQVGFRDLTVWSFLMASAHGAGLMLMPFMLVLPSAMPSHSMGHSGMNRVQLTQGALNPLQSWLVPVAVHTLGYVALLVVAAVIVYDRLGLAILRRAWINLDVVWAAALVATGILSFFL